MLPPGLATGDRGLNFNASASMARVTSSTPAFKPVLADCYTSVPSAPTGHPDGDGLVLDESAPLGVNLHHWSYYSRAKVEAEKLIWAAHQSKKLACTVIRPSWLYGPRDRATMGRLIDSIRRGKAKLIGPGDNRLNVVHAGNVAEASILAVDSDEAAGEAFNVCSDGVLTQAEYFNLVAKAIGCPQVTRRVPYKVARSAAFMLECFGHLFRTKTPPLVTRYSAWLLGRRCFFSREKAQKQLGWESSITYDEGVPAAVEDFLQDSPLDNQTLSAAVA